MERWNETYSFVIVSGTLLSKRRGHGFTLRAFAIYFSLTDYV